MTGDTNADKNEASGKQSTSEEDTTYDAKKETVTEAWEGVFIYESWGYNRTTVNFAQIVEVSDSGKTVLARMVNKKQADTSKGVEHLRPSAEQFGDEFRLHVRASKDEPIFRGSYPYINGDMDEGKRMGTFLVFGNEAERTVYQTLPNHGH